MGAAAEGADGLKKIWAWGRTLFFQYKEPLLYLFFGGLTTLINIAVYTVLADLLGVYYLTANAAAWVLSVLFAYLTNRRFVFESRSRGAAAVLRELALFTGCRLLSGAFDMGCMYLCVDLIRLPGLAAKILSNVLVVILNYLFSKFLIFRGRQKDAL